jgi:hypothetical protein
MPLDSYLSGMQAQAQGADHVLAWWIPYTDTVQARTNTRTSFLVQMQPITSWMSDTTG